MPAPLDPATLPLDIAAVRDLLLQRESEHAAELQAARAGLQEQVLRTEQLKLRLAKVLRERFGASSEKLSRVEVRDRGGNPQKATLETRYRRIRVLPPIGKQKRFPATCVCAAIARLSGSVSEIWSSPVRSVGGMIINPGISRGAIADTHAPTWSEPVSTNRHPPSVRPPQSRGRNARLQHQCHGQPQNVPRP